MASTYKIGQQPQPQPIQQYPPFYDPQKQKEKEDLENAPNQLMNIFANAKGFEGASWQMDEVTALNNELNKKMKHILFSDYSPAAKQYAAAALLIDNISGEMYNKRAALSDFKTGEDEYTKLLNNAVQQKSISQDEADQLELINMARNKKNYKEKGSQARYEPYLFSSLNNFDNYYGPKFLASKNESGAQISGQTTGDTKKDLTASGAKVTTTATSTITPGLGNESFTYYSLDKYEDDVADIFIDDFTIKTGFMAKVNRYNDYMEAFEFEYGPVNDENKREEIKKRFFLNSPVIQRDGKIVTNKEEIDAVVFGLKPEEIKKGKEVDGVNYTFNYDEFKDNNKERVINKDEIATMERFARSSGSGGERKIVHVPGYNITGTKDKVLYTNESITAQQTLEIRELMKNSLQLFTIDYSRIDNFEELNNTPHEGAVIKAFSDNNYTNIVDAFLAHGYNTTTEPELLFPSVANIDALVKAGKITTKEDPIDYMNSHAVIATSINLINPPSNGNGDRSTSRNLSLTIPVIVGDSNSSGNTSMEFSQDIMDIIKTLPTRKQKQEQKEKEQKA